MMKNLLHCLLITIGVSQTAHGQTAKPAGDKVVYQALDNQAHQMSHAFIARDYGTFAKFMNPAVVKESGGMANIEAALAKVDETMHSQGVKVLKIDFGPPSKIVRQGNELQCTLPQQTDFQLPSGKIRSTSTLIAVSTDNGVHWTFIDTSTKDMQAIRKMLPNLSASIQIHPGGPPVSIP